MVSGYEANWKTVSTKNKHVDDLICETTEVYKSKQGLSNIVHDQLTCIK